MVDPELMSPAGFSLSREFLLVSLLNHPYVKLFRYRDVGSTTDSNLQPSGDSAKLAGWATIDGKDGDGRPQALITDDQTASYVWMPGNTGEYGRQHTNARAYPELGPDSAAARRERDGLALQVAAAAAADIFITNRQYLFELPDSLKLGVTICNPEDALALIALYLREQNEFVVWRRSDGVTFYLGGELYYWVGVRELLPASWRWYTACIQESSASNDAKLKDLAESLPIRVQRGLQARDRFHLAFNRPQDVETSRQVLAELDTMLVLLMSAVDITARVAHHVLSLPPNNAYRAGWQSNQWLTAVRNADANLAGLYSTNSNNSHALTILRLLRNTVHGQAIRSMPTRLSGGSIQTEIQLPTDEENDILTSMDALGGRATWGARAANGGTLIDPSTLIERLWPQVLRLLNETMDATPVERLSNVQLTAADRVPPPDSTDGTPGTFDKLNRESIRWQLGF